MKYILSLVTLLLISSSISIAQNESEAEVNARVESIHKVSQFLCAYDRFAWVSSDSLQKLPGEKLQNLGREWFCYQDSTARWHAIYGKFDSLDYKIAAHYVSDTSGAAILTTEDPDYPLCYLFGKTLNNAYKQYKSDSGYTRTNYVQYIRKNPSGSVNVWFFPGIQEDGKIPFGREAHYEYSGDGSTLKAKNIIKKTMMFYMPNASEAVTLDYSDYDFPTLGAVFYADNYGKYFKKVFIKTKTRIHAAINGVWTFVDNR